LSQLIAADSVLLGCDSVSGKWVPSYVSPKIEQCKSFFVLGPWVTPENEDTGSSKGREALIRRQSVTSQGAV
jgi:hypothetical protein